MITNTEFLLNYESAKNHQLSLERIVDEKSKKLMEYPKGLMGLTPDEIKNTAQWKNDKKNFELAFSELRSFNAFFTKKYKKERAAIRKELLEKMMLTSTNQ